MNNERKRRIFSRLKILNEMRSAIGIATAILIIFFGFENIVIIVLLENRKILISFLTINFLLRIMGHIMSTLKIKIDSDLLISNPYMVFGILAFEMVVLTLFQMDLFFHGMSGVTVVIIAIIYVFGSSVIGKAVSKRIQKSTP